MAQTCGYLANLFSLSGRTALVTGASRGIGRALAISIASAGADLVLTLRDPSTAAATSLTKEIEALGRKVTIYQVDLAHKDSIASLIPRLRADGVTIDILVNNAGVQHQENAENFLDEDWERIVQVNLNAVFTLCRGVGKWWLEEGRTYRHGAKKKIINISSVAQYRGSTRVVAYAATKGAVGQLTKTLSNEWTSKGICVNSIAPGFVATDMTAHIREQEDYNNAVLNKTPVGRWGKGEDLSGITIYLASRARWVISFPELVVKRC
jgi:2-deoxy-D-gluconate 3-dehydrogenase